MSRTGSRGTQECSKTQTCGIHQAFQDTWEKASPIYEKTSSCRQRCRRALGVRGDTWRVEEHMNTVERAAHALGQTPRRPGSKGMI